jgi:dTDP-glucose 4,6-dehydratase
MISKVSKNLNKVVKVQAPNILITGGAGFIGSHLVEYLLNNHPTYNIVNLDALTYAGDNERNANVASNPRYKFIYGNICDEYLVEDIFKTYEISSVFHLAAETHVDNSISSPRIFVETNVGGTLTLLEVARRHWQDDKSKAKNPRFIHVSTDEVYGSLGDTGYFTESSPYAPNSPYSASKASSDFLVRSYFHTFGLPVIITNCSNNYGPAQHNEKLIPTIIRNALEGREIPIYGNGKNIRDWLYVRDHCTALDKVFQGGKLGESYNIGTHNEKTNVEIANLVCENLDKLKPLINGSYKDQISFVTDRLGHDFRYAIDNNKISDELKWNAASTFENDLNATVKWYIKLYENQ